ncbi:cytoplasmic protein [Mucilaginibacter sp. PAMC 26640]|nr:cytoplasmic protein [Mucilaginibacter sp. PAMC 26640]
MDKPSYLNFKVDQYAWKPDINYRVHPELYRVGKGEQGVLICEPYKGEIGRHWRFKTEAIAIESSDAIYNQFLDFVKQDDFVGMDMARKYLQMGYTRARRYANYKGGKKYDKAHNYQQLQRGTGEDEKAKAAAIFYQKWKAAEGIEPYRTLKAQWKKEKG